MIRTLAGVLFVGVFGATVAPASLWAHHSSGGQFDVTRSVTVTGRVVRVEWVNPHVYLYLDVDRPGGDGGRWTIELGSPNALRRLGWSPDSVCPGHILTVEGYRAQAQARFTGATSVLDESTGARLRVSPGDPRE